MYQEFKLVAGHLKERKGRYYVVVSYTDTTGKRISREFSTGLPVKGNKKKRTTSCSGSAERKAKSCTR